LHPKEIHDNKQFWLEEHRKRRGEDVKGYQAMRNHTNCVYLRMLS